MLQSPRRELSVDNQQEQKTPTQPRVNWWLRIASTGWDQPQETIEQREKVRRSRLMAWIILAMLLCLLAFIPATFSDRASAITVVVTTICVVITVVLNRKGFVTVAGTFLVVLTIAAVMGVIVGSTDGKIHLVYLPAFDILVVSVILGASILPRIAAFIIASANVILIYADLLLQPWSPDLHQAIAQYGMPVIAGRPVAIQIVAAIIAFLWTRGMDQAIRRADRAEELRILEQRFKESEAEHARIIEEFIRKMITAVEALANGHEGMVILPPEHPLQAQATFVNTQLKQFYKLKQSNSITNEQTLHAARILLTMLQRINSNQMMINGLDPRQFTTQVPVIDEIAMYLYFFLHGKRVPMKSSAGTSGSITNPNQRFTNPNQYSPHSNQQW
ncbi:hypothetical protein [Dictyobacter formicarum]|uniref:FUSC family protein n=1 Tax=Dictyobacter formicarum TaxID=2778368 RepID=A0ABQ3VBB1_9CHLR|nr:hypothetical protein [Dictyobacter formicarum]GHO83182.1 hypothetical protein KSZ_11880 [Dictyobacter formicarum]